MLSRNWRIDPPTEQHPVQLANGAADPNAQVIRQRELELLRHCVPIARPLVSDGY